MIVDRLIFAKHFEKGEKVLTSVHKHWIDILKSTLEIGFFGFVIPWGFYFMGFNTIFFFWGAVIWSFLAYMRYLYVLLDWYSDVWLITDMGLLIIDWRGFFSNSATRVGFDDIEGVSYVIDGFWPTVLRYGTLTLNVMSGNNLTLPHAANPKRAELNIMKFQLQIMNQREMTDASRLKQLLAQIVATQVKK